MSSAREPGRGTRAEPHDAPHARLTIRRGRPIGGDFTPPGDKSITHRAYLIGAIATGETRVESPNPGRDAESTLACLAALGVEARREPWGVRVIGRPPGQPAGVLDCGNSGTTLRLLVGLLSARPLAATLTGDASLRRRPVDRVMVPLRAMGADLSASDGDRYPPITVRGGPLRAIRYAAPIASAQVASAILLAALGADGETSVELPGPARDHTERMLPAFGVPVEIETRPGLGPRVSLRGPVTPSATTVRVPGDPSAAAFFLAAAAATPGSSVTARDMSLNPTRVGFLDVLAAMGAEVRRSAARDHAGEPVGDVTVVGPDRLRGFAVPGPWLPRLIDEVPAWAIVAACADGTSRVSGAGELRFKESDRLSAIADALATLGVSARESPEGLEIDGGRARGGTVHARGDHRIAMAFAVLGTLASGPVTVEDTENVATSYPEFVATLNALGGVVDSVPAGTS
jgi:3-phosphoshikimate 1-carboxyvinyltransferase